jgi:hypothetical protein
LPWHKFHSGRGLIFPWTLHLISLQF